MIGYNRGQYVAVPFWDRVQRLGDSECWPWTASVLHDGYGHAWFERRGQPAHRVAWKLLRGPIPDGLFVLHRCDNPPCCNPDHLFLGTKGDNNRDRAAKGRSRSRRGSQVANSKLTEADVLRIRDLLGRVPQDVIAARFGVSRGVVSHVATGRSWAWVPR